MYVFFPSLLLLSLLYLHFHFLFHFHFHFHFSSLLFPSLLSPLSPSSHLLTPFLTVSILPSRLTPARQTESDLQHKIFRDVGRNIFEEVGKRMKEAEDIEYLSVCELLSCTTMEDFRWPELSQRLLSILFPFPASEDADDVPRVILIRGSPASGKTHL